MYFGLMYPEYNNSVSIMCHQIFWNANFLIYFIFNIIRLLRKDFRAINYLIFP